MECDGIPAGQEGEHRFSLSLLEALAGLASDARRVITEVIVLHREFPAWAMWLPYQGRPWTAVRPASARAPGPDLPLIWVHAVTTAELSDQMRRADAQLRPP